MYKCLLVLASAQALARPQRALAVRGGEIDPIAIGKGVVLASGIYGAFDPAGNLDKYGIKAEDKGNAMMRVTAWSQILFAAALNADVDSAHGQMAYLSVAFLLIVQPCFEKFQSPKLPDAIWMAVSAAIGYKTLDGSLDKRVAAAVWLANGAQFFFAPQSAIGMYEMKGTNKLCKAMMGQCACPPDLDPFAAAKCALQDAEDLNAPKAGPLAWTALSAGLAYKALN